MREDQKSEDFVDLGAATELTHGEYRRDFVEAPLVIDHWTKP